MQWRGGFDTAFGTSRYLLAEKFQRRLPPDKGPGDRELAQQPDTVHPAGMVVAAWVLVLVVEYRYQRTAQLDTLGPHLVMELGGIAIHHQ